MGVLSYVLFSRVAKNYSQSYSSVNQSDQTTDLTDYLSHFGVFALHHDRLPAVPAQPRDHAHGLDPPRVLRRDAPQHARSRRRPS